jgi:ATP-binding cassette subfamily C protein
VRLSGGERQRIALARALVRQPKLLILDEATSSLDGENQQHIQKAISSLRGRTTVVIIAHRLSSVMAADQIIVIEEGRILESGSFDDLIKHPETRFRKMLRSDSCRAA